MRREVLTLYVFDVVFEVGRRGGGRALVAPDLVLGEGLVKGAGVGGGRAYIPGPRSLFLRGDAKRQRLARGLLSVQFGFGFVFFFLFRFAGGLCS